MARIGLLLAVLLIFGEAPFANAQGDSHWYTNADFPSSKPSSLERDSRGRIKRSRQAKKEFKAMHLCPATGQPTGACPGYVIDHVEPLKRGGLDAPSNMQWQTKEEAKAKDRWE